MSPRQLLGIAGGRLPDGYRRKLDAFRYGPGACKLDWALDAPIPWAAEACRRAATVHLGGTMEEIAASERAPWQGVIAEKPFVLLSQPTLFDPARAPGGKHIAWAYCHVPNGSNVDMTERIENQIERFAPGFRSHILKRSVRTAGDLENYNPNLGGWRCGRRRGGLEAVSSFGPRERLYRILPHGGFTCAPASTPPGGGVLQTLRVSGGWKRGGYGILF